MAQTRKPSKPQATSHGGTRTGAGRKPRVPGKLADCDVMLRFTLAEFAAVELAAGIAREPALAIFCRDAVLRSACLTCELCGAIAYDLNGKPLHGKHVCAPVE